MVAARARASAWAIAWDLEASASTTVLYLAASAGRSTSAMSSVARSSARSFAAWFWLVAISRSICAAWIGPAAEAWASALSVSTLIAAFWRARSLLLSTTWRSASMRASSDF